MTPTAAFRCPACGVVNVPIRDLLILLPGEGRWPRYAASCPGCGEVVGGEIARSKVLGAIRAIVRHGLHPVVLPPAEVPTFAEPLSLDHLIDLHESLKDAGE